ncbi:MAG: family 16 glycoside hydrolase [Gemmataceae bacterium]
MRWFLSLTVGLMGVTLLAADKPRVFVFAADEIGKTPKGWTVAKTGMFEGSVWQVVKDPTAPSGTGQVLAQLAEGERRLFNLCVVDDTHYRDLEASVRYKAVAGEIDQGGGIVWRYQDPNNYYIARYNPLETNFRVYKVIDGKREQLESHGNLDLPAGQWHTLTIRQQGNRIECLLDGKSYLQVQDDTLTKPGKVGLWTKADAKTYFDELRVAPR